MAAGAEDYNTILSTRRGRKAVTRWLISQSVLNQFQVARGQTGTPWRLYSRRAKFRILARP